MVRCVEAFHLGLTASLMDMARSLDAVVHAAPAAVVGGLHQRRLDALQAIPLDRLFEGAFRLVGDPPPPPAHEAMLVWSSALYQRVPLAIGDDQLGIGGWRIGLCIGMFLRELRVLWLPPDAAVAHQVRSSTMATASLVQIRDLLGTVISDPGSPEVIREVAERFLTLAERVVFASNGGVLAGDSPVLVDVLATVESEAFEPSLLHRLTAATLPLRVEPKAPSVPNMQAVRSVGADSTVPADDILRVIEAVQRIASRDMVPGFSIALARASTDMTTWTTIRSSGEVEVVRIPAGAVSGSVPLPSQIGTLEFDDVARLASELVRHRFETLALPPGTPPAPATEPRVQLVARLEQDVMSVEFAESEMARLPGFDQIVTRFEILVKKADNALGATVAAPLHSAPPTLRVRVVLRHTMMRFVTQGAYVPSGELPKTWFLRVPSTWFDAGDPRARINDALQRIFQRENTRLRASDPNDPNYLAVTSFECWVVTSADAKVRVWEQTQPVWELSVCWAVDDTNCNPVPPSEF